MPANLENSAVARGLEKVSFHFNPIDSQCQRTTDYQTIKLISHASKVMFKSLQARLQRYVNGELPDDQLDLEKVKGQEITFPTSTGSLKMQENSRKTSTSALLTTLSI